MNCCITCLSLSSPPKVLSTYCFTKLVGLVTGEIKIQETYSVHSMPFCPRRKMIADSFSSVMSDVLFHYFPY